MKASPRVLSLACGLLSLTLPVSATYAQTVLLNETWEGYSIGAVPIAPWQTRFGGGTTPDASQTTIVSQVVGGTTSNWALVGNNATNEPVSNPSLLATFTASSQLNISFSFMIPANYGNASQELFNLGYISPDGQTTKIALSLYLGPNYQSSTSMLGYKTSAGARVDVGGAFVAGQQMNVSLLNINKATGTYDLSWTTSGGGSGLLSNIALTGAVPENWNFVSFGESSAVGSTSLLYVDNIRVEAIPEPATWGLAAGAGVICLLVRRRRKSVVCQG